MSETKEPEYRWLHPRTGAIAPHDGAHRYRVEDGHLVYDPEPEPEPEPESIDEVRYVNPNMLNPYWTQAHIYTEPMGSADFPVRVRDKAADEELVKYASDYGNLSAQVSSLTRELDEARASRAAAINQAEDLDNERIRRIAELERERDEAREHHRRLVRERDEAIKARDDWQMSAEWGWSDVGHGTELLKQAEDRIAELERQVAELRRVLQQAEWGCACGEQGGACPLCDAAFLRPNVTTKHKPSCPLGRALGRPECGEVEA